MTGPVPWRIQLMKKRLNALALAVSAAVLAMGASYGRADDSVPVSSAEGGQLWFVELTGNPVADGNTASAVRNEQAAFRRAAAAAGIPYTERRSFATLFNGLSINVAPQDRTKIAQLGGVKAMYRIGIVEAPKPEFSGGSAPDLASAIQMTGADIA